MFRNKTTALLVVVIVVIGCVLLLKEFLRPVEMMFSGNDSGERMFSGNDDCQIQKDDVAKMLIAQRNNVSRAYNLNQQKLGQVECEKLQLKSNATSGTATSGTGGWCKQTSREDSGEHATDRKLVPALIDFFQGKYVASFGDGPGRYKQLLSDSGKLIGYDAYDGAPYCDVTSEGRVRFLDLTLPQYGLPLYDWVMSLEVAEHISAEFESVYIDNIVRHAKEGIVLSWAKLGQGGYQHINNRPIEYVVNLFGGLGFSHDKETSIKLKNASSLSWLRDNLNVYRRNVPYSDTFSGSQDLYI